MMAAARKAPYGLRGGGNGSSSGFSIGFGVGPRGPSVSAGPMFRPSSGDPIYAHAGFGRGGGLLNVGTLRDHQQVYFHEGVDQTAAEMQRRQRLHEEQQARETAERQREERNRRGLQEALHKNQERLRQSMPIAKIAQSVRSYTPANHQGRPHPLTRKEKAYEEPSILRYYRTLHDKDRSFYGHLHKACISTGIDRRDRATLWGDPLLNPVIHWGRLTEHEQAHMSMESPYIHDLADEVSRSRGFIRDKLIPSLQRVLDSPVERLIDEIIVPVATIGLVLTGDMFFPALTPATAPVLAASCVRLAPALPRIATAMGASELYRQATHLLNERFKSKDGSCSGTKSLEQPEMSKHHIFNKFRGESLKSQKYRDFFQKHKIDIDKYSVEITRKKHVSQVHTAGNNWTTKWKDWIDANPNASTKEVYQFAGKLMDEYGLSHVPLVPYK